MKSAASAHTVQFTLRSLLANITLCSILVLYAVIRIKTGVSG